MGLTLKGLFLSPHFLSSVPSCLWAAVADEDKNISFLPWLQSFGWMERKASCFLMSPFGKKIIWAGIKPSGGDKILRGENVLHRDETSEGTKPSGAALVVLELLVEMGWV